MAKKKTNEPHPDQIDNGIVVDLGTLARELRLRTEERDAIASERGRISNQLKIADEAVEHATAAIVAASRPKQMALMPARVRREEDPGELVKPDPEIVDDRTTLSGTTGGPIGEGTSYEMTMSDENPAECICGWEIASPIDGHDRRHGQYVRALKDEAGAPLQPEKRATRAASPAKKKPALSKTPPAKKKAARR